jgi:hypothetical protein
MSKDFLLRLQSERRGGGTAAKKWKQPNRRNLFQRHHHHPLTLCSSIARAFEINKTAESSKYVKSMLERMGSGKKKRFLPSSPNTHPD